VIGLAASLPDVALVAENNPLPDDHAYVAGLDPAAAACWYLDTERRRIAYATELAARLAHQHPPGQVVCDKGALATLAYVYAGAVVGLHPPSLYPQVRARYLREIRPRLPADATTIVFTGPPELGLTRRGDKPDRALRPVWFDATFLLALARFYTEQAPDLVGHRLLRLDAAPTRPQLLTDLAAALALNAPTQPVLLDPVDYQHLPAPFRREADRIGPAVLGRALGLPFPQPSGTVQAFERHLLLAEPASARRRRGTPPPGMTVRLQARHWTPRTPTTAPAPAVVHEERTIRS